MSLSLVPDSAISKDPRNLAYLFPRLPLLKYKYATDRYFTLKAIKAAEDLARINNQLLVPASCLHWERKKKFKDRQVLIFGKSYYAIQRNELTPTEIRKYENLVNES